MTVSIYRSPYHSNREIVVDDAVGDRVSLLLLVIGDNIYVPAVQHHLCAVLDVPEELQQASALVTCREEPERKVESGENKSKFPMKEGIHNVPKSTPFSTVVLLPSKGNPSATACDDILRQQCASNFAGIPFPDLNPIQHLWGELKHQPNPGLFPSNSAQPHYCSEPGQNPAARFLNNLEKSSEEEWRRPEQRTNVHDCVMRYLTVTCRCNPRIQGVSAYLCPGVYMHRED